MVVKRIKALTVAIYPPPRSHPSVELANETKSTTIRQYWPEKEETNEYMDWQGQFVGAGMPKEFYSMIVFFLLTLPTY